MVRTYASTASAGFGEKTPSVVAGRGKGRGRPRVPIKGHTVMDRGRAPARSQEHARVVSVNPHVD